MMTGKLYIGTYYYALSASVKLFASFHVISMKNNQKVLLCQRAQKIY